MHREDWVVLLGSAGSGFGLVEVGHCGQVGGWVGPSQILQLTSRSGLRNLTRGDLTNGGTVR